MAVALGATITSIVLSSTDGAAGANVPVTFGQVFVAGDLAAGSFVELKPSGGVAVPCQLDVKATHDDGTIRHAVLSAIIPAVPATGSVTYGIVRAAAGPAGSALTPANFNGLNATVTLSDNGIAATGPAAGTVYTADAGAQLASGTYETWLSGPVASEWIVRAPLKTAGGAVHPDLHARFSIRGYAGQTQAKIDYVVENNWAKPKATPSGSSPWETVSVDAHVYSYSLKAGGTTVDSRAVNGAQLVRFGLNANTSSRGTYDATATGLANDATVYTATMTVDGASKAISITGSAAQTFGQLKTLLSAQLGAGATCKSDVTNLGLEFKSASTGAGSYITITNYGTLFPALGASGPYRPIRGDEYVHYARTRWKKTFWWGTAPHVHIAHNKAYLASTKAVPNYQADLTGSAATISTDLAALNANGDLGQNGITKAFMADTGYAPGIGMLPEWTAMYLVNQGADAKYIMLKMADLSGSWPVHVREYNTDKPLSFETWPYATFSPNSGDSVNPATGLQEKLPDMAALTTLPGNRMQPEVAHHPDFCSVPYLVTGDHYYLEGMLFYQRWTTLSANAHSSYRDGRKSLWKVEQVRGQAWNMRTAVHTAYLVPTGHPLRADVQYQIDQNISWYTTNYLAPGSPYGNVFGAIIHGGSVIYQVNGQNNVGLAVWQDSFFTATCGRAVELGFSSYLDLLKFKSKLTVGLLTSGAAFCWQAATMYLMQFRDTEASPLYTTFSQVYQASATPAMKAAACGSQAMADALGVPLNAMAGYPADVGGFPANMQPAVAYAATYGTPGADNAWTVLDARSAKPDYNTGPQFSITPRSVAVSYPMTGPADIYTVASGKPIYGGRAAPSPVTNTFGDVTITKKDLGGFPSDTQFKNLPFVMDVHGSGGASLTNGMQYRAPVSGYMALPGVSSNLQGLDYDSRATFGFSVCIAYDSSRASLRPIDRWSNDAGALRESEHMGFVLSDGKLHLIEERRYDAAWDWIPKNLPLVDMSRLALTGGSMGGWGTLTYGLMRPHMFAALYPDRPRVNGAKSTLVLAVWDGSTNFVGYTKATAPMLADEDGGGSAWDRFDAIGRISNPANKVCPILWCLGRQDGFATMDEQLALLKALRDAGRFHVFTWNNGDHGSGSRMNKIWASYPMNTFKIGRGYPLFTECSRDQDPAVDKAGGVNIDLKFQNVAETATGWSCEVTCITPASSSGVLAAGSTTTVIQLPGTESEITNDYKGGTITINGESQTVLAYDGTDPELGSTPAKNKLVTVAGFSAAPAAGAAYTITRAAYPVTVKVSPISEVFATSVAKKTVSIPGPGVMVPVTFP